MVSQGAFALADPRTPKGKQAKKLQKRWLQNTPLIASWQIYLDTFASRNVSSFLLSDI